MILTCPSCGTQYVVKDGAIPPEGRQVRCASCKHSWHQDPDGGTEGSDEVLAPAPAALDEETAVEAPAGRGDELPPAPAAEDESLAEATLIEPRSGPEAEERAFEEAKLDEVSEESGVAAGIGPAVEAETAESDWGEPPQAESQPDDFTPYSASDEIQPPRKRGPLLSILIVVLVVIAVAAAFWFLAPPSLKARLGLAEVSATPLALVTTHMDRQRLESGNELLTVTGRVINPTGKEQAVPPLQAQLKTRAGKIVYSWTIAPPARSLAPGSSASFNSAEVNVPAGGEELTISLGAPAT